MNLLHLSTPNSWRGGEQQMIYLMESLKGMPEVHQCVLCPKNSVVASYCQAHGLNAIYFSSQSMFFRALQIKKLCKKQSIDIIHAHDGHAVGLAALSHFIGNDTDVVLHRRVDFAVKNNVLSRYKYNHSSVKKIICVSNAVREVLLPALKDASKAVTIYSCIDLHKFQNLTDNQRLHQLFHLPKEAMLVGNTSAIADHKDYFTFVDVAEKVVAEMNQVYFFIIGNGPLDKEIHEYVASKGLQEKILFTGFRNDIPELLSELDVFLITSKTEGLGTSILDAFASHLPVVATAAGGIPEIVHHQKTGMLANVKDAKTLADEVMVLLKDDAVKNTVIQGATELLKSFSQEQLGQNIYQVYCSVIK